MALFALPFALVLECGRLKQEVTWDALRTTCENQKTSKNTNDVLALIHSW